MAICVAAWYMAGVVGAALADGVATVGAHEGHAAGVAAGTAAAAGPADEPAAAETGTTDAADHFWPQWRGPRFTGVAPYADPPLEWSNDRNIRWKVALPGRGHSSPVVWGDRVYLTAAVPYGNPLEPRYSGAPGAHDNVSVRHRYEFVVFAVNRVDGSIIWQRTVHRDLPHEGGHYSGSLASASPITDGEHVFAFFGSRGLYCLGRDGEVIWQKDLGRMQTKHGHGEGSSPVLYGDTLVVSWDHEGPSFLVAFDRETGRELWKIPRDEPSSWATPVVIAHGDRRQLIVPGTNRMRGYDLADGRVIWACGGLAANIVASPVAGGGMAFAGSSYDKRAMIAVRLGDAAGDITATDHVAWRRVRGVPYVPSLLLYDDILYFLAHYQGVMTRLHAPTGSDRPGAFRLPDIGDVYASPVAAAGRVYVTDRAGSTLVIAHDDESRFLASNQLNDTFNASAALAGCELFLRGQDYLYCIAEDGTD